MKQFIYWILAVSIVYGFIELSAFGGLILIHKYHRLKYEPVDILSQEHADIIKTFLEKNTNYIQFSSTLGWSIKSNGYSNPYRANSSGIRSDKEYEPNPPPGVVRITTFGDSFTHGSNVGNKDTWQAIMESGDSKLEVINFGVGGFGLDQAYLRYLHEEIIYKSQFVLIGFMAEHIYRNVNSYRPFFHPETRLPFAKPRFVIKNEKLSLVSNPMRTLEDYRTLLTQSPSVLSQLGANDFFYQNRRYVSNIADCSPTVRLGKIAIQEAMNKISANKNIVVNLRYNEDSEAFIVTKQIFDEFYQAVLKNNSKPIILIFPRQRDVDDYRKYKIKVYSPLLSYFDSVGYKYIDLMDVFETVAVEKSFNGHYSPYGNKLVAEYLLNHFRNLRN